MENKINIYRLTEYTFFCIIYLWKLKASIDPINTILMNRQKFKDFLLVQNTTKKTHKYKI